MSTDTILLQPRPYARVSGRLLLLPLLPLKKPIKPLPVELWHQIFALALLDDEDTILARSLLTVCKAFKVSLRVPVTRIHLQLDTTRRYLCPCYT